MKADLETRPIVAAGGTEVILTVEDVSLSFGGVKAIQKKIHGSPDSE